jgi:hypothetical protein
VSDTPLCGSLRTAARLFEQADLDASMTVMTTGLKALAGTGLHTVLSEAAATPLRSGARS